MNPTWWNYSGWVLSTADWHIFCRMSKGRISQKVSHFTQILFMLELKQVVRKLVHHKKKFTTSSPVLRTKERILCVFLNSFTLLQKYS
jgi:hypothetical protein